jgi:threonine/homoserine/homoserine lactone efflux protein
LFCFFFAAIVSKPLLSEQTKTNDSNFASSGAIYRPCFYCPCFPFYSMITILRIIAIGIFISFIGMLPLGTINLSAMQIAVTDGLQSAILFALGMIPADIVYVLITLLAMQWIQKQKKLFRAMEWLTLLIVLALAAANFYAAIHPSVQKNVLLSSTLPPFLLGLVMNIVNPLQIPFWFGWNTVLATRKILVPGWQCYAAYCLGVSIGLFTGTSVFIFGGQLIAESISSHQALFSFVIGGIFALTAIYYGWKMRRKKDVLQKLKHPEEITVPFEKTVDKLTGKE